LFLFSNNNLLNFSYDGKSVGDIVQDAIRNIPGAVSDVNGGFALSANGAFSISSQTANTFGDSSGKNFTIIFNPASVVPTDYENRPVFGAVLETITY